MTTPNIPGRAPAMLWRRAARTAAVLAVLLSLCPASTAQGMAEAREQVRRRIRESGAEVAVAVRTLDGKQELFIEADAEFHAASMMKVPVMVELFAQAREGKLRLDDELSVVNQFHSIVDGSPYQLDAADDSDPEVYRAIGSRMTLRRLCEAMITVSSNLAANLLIEKLGAQNVQRRLQALEVKGITVLRGVEDGKALEKGLNNTVTARGLLVLFERIATRQAVDPASDEEMIAILKRQKFNDAIPAGLPSLTPVAHKTGEITRIHHDGGVVYDKRPYVLVVLVRGMEDQKQSAALIADITRLVHAAARAR